MERSVIHQAERGSGYSDSEHREAVTFVNRHRDFFEHYARGRVSFKPAPPGLKTFAFDLNSNDIYVNSVFYKKRGFSDEKTSFATCHEVEHFEEKKQLLSERRGEQTFAAYVERIKHDQAFGLLDNCVADIRQNRAVVSKTSEAFLELEQDIYRNDLFKETDFTQQPKHIQFAQALLREARVPDETCVVAPEVREKLNQIYAQKGTDGTALLDAMTHPDTPMSTRLKLQDKFLWPIVQELREKDMEENKQKQQGEGGEGESQPREEQQDGSGETIQKEKSGWFRRKKKRVSTKAPSVQGPKQRPADPNEIFKDAYDRAHEKVMNAVPIEKQEDALRAWRGGGDPLEQADQNYADKLGVRKEELQNYRRIAESLNQIVNPETNERVVEELRALIERIIAKRLKSVPAPRYPTEEGEDLVDPAGLVADVRAGNLEPKVWETTETQKRRGSRFGEVEITLVFDRSASMQGAKLNEQRKAAVLVMEALKELNERADDERTRMDKPLEVRSEAYGFCASAQDATPLKSMEKELTERQRIAIATTLGSAPGAGTNDFTPLEAIVQNITPTLVHRIVEGELKKIVIIFTDGGSDDIARVQKALKTLREKGIVAIGIGITQSGAAALQTYAPNAVLVSQAEDLPRALGDILKEHLAGV